MQVLEIKNNLVKVAYDVIDNLFLSGFVVIEDTNMPYVGQVVSLKADLDTNYAMVKLLFTFDENGILNNYNGSIPSLKSNISALPSEELLGIIPVETPVIVGKLAQQDFVLKLDKTIFENNLVICSNKPENTSILVKNFLTQLERTGQKTVVFDTDGSLSTAGKLVFGRDFRLPLSYESINFIYENGLNDVDAASKALIQDIFIEVQDYIKTVPENFIPFSTFLNVIDGQYRETNIVELILLKNKLLKYRDENIFAQNLKDILKLNMALENNDVTIIDISNTDENLRGEVINYVYDVLEKIDAEIYSFVKVDNGSSNKKLLKRFTDKINISTTILCGHEYKYLPELKQFSDDLILFAPHIHGHDFADYNTFLNKLNYGEFVICGNYTQNIPLIVQLDDLETIEAEIERLEELAAQKITADVDEIYNTPKEPLPALEDEIETGYTEIDYAEVDYAEVEVEFEKEENLSTISDFVPSEIDAETEDIAVDEVFEPIEDEGFEPVYEELAAPAYEELPPEEIVEDEIEDGLEGGITEQFDKLEQLEQQGEQVEQRFDDLLDLNEEIDLDDTFEIPEIIEGDFVSTDFDDLDTEPAEEIFAEEFSQIAEPETAAPAETTPAETAPTENISLETAEPELPIYPTNDIERKNVPVFEQGDAVSHPKYGTGTVEKMIKYGNKTLCSINFENIGRRLLDPAISEISKL